MVHSLQLRLTPLQTSTQTLNIQSSFMNSLLQRRSSLSCDELPDRCRASERNLLDDGVFAHFLPYLLDILLCRHNVHDAVRYPRALGELRRRNYWTRYGKRRMEWTYFCQRQR